MDQGSALECPGCGAFYEKVEKAMSTLASPAATSEKSSAGQDPVVEKKASTFWSPRNIAIAAVGIGALLLSPFSPIAPIILVLSPLLYFIFRKRPDIKDMSDYLALALTKEPNFSITKSLLGLNGNCGILFDETKRKIMIFEGAGEKFGLYNEEDVLSCEVIEDGSIVSSTSTGVGKAALGGIAFGAVGLVAGALVGTKESRTKTEISEIYLLIKTDQRSYPIHRIDLFNSKKPVIRTESTVKAAMRTAEDASALMALIIRPSSKSGN